MRYVIPWMTPLEAAAAVCALEAVASAREAGGNHLGAGLCRASKKAIETALRITLEVDA